MSSRAVAVRYQHAPGIRADQPDDDVERRGFARAVRPQQAHHFALLHPQRNVVHHFAAAVALRDFGGLKSAHEDVLFILAMQNALGRLGFDSVHQQPIILGEPGQFLALRRAARLSTNFGRPSLRITLSSST